MKQNILIIGSSTKSNGGISTVINNFLKYDNWEEYKIYHIKTHVDGSKFKKMFFFLINYIYLFIYLFFKKVDIVHIHMSMFASFKRKYLVVKMCKLFNKKIIIHHHGSKLLEFIDSLNNKDKFEYLIMNVNLNIVLNYDIFKKFKQINENVKVEILYNSVPVPEKNYYNFTSEYILFLGRLCERKGVYDLLKVIKTIDKIIDKKYKFMLCGDGEIEKVKEIIKRENLSDRCIIKGWIDKNEKVNILKNTILNVLPSYNEGLPMTILETMSYGIPNISTNISSIPEVIDSSNGYLIDPGDIDLLKNTIISFLNKNTEDKLMMSNNAYNKLMRNFNQISYFNFVKKIYQRVGCE